MSKTSSNQSSLMVGNLDKEGKYPFPASWAGYSVVWQAKVQNVQGNLLELPNQSGLQTYYPEQLDKLMNDNNGQFFKDSELRVTVLHDPRLTADAGSEETGKKEGKKRGKKAEAAGDETGADAGSEETE